MGSMIMLFHMALEIVLTSQEKYSVMIVFFLREFPDKVASMFAMIELFFGIGELWGGGLPK